MASSVSPIPAGYHAITPSLTCRDAARAIDFYKNILGATEIARMTGPDGKVMHAELKFGDSVVFLADEFPGMSAAPAATTTTGVYLYLYVKDVDSTFKAAVAAGCQVNMPVETMFWGDRYGKFIDPFGHHWGIATHVEDITPAEMERRSAEFTLKMAQSAGQS